uniref:Uncharacterized protein n=1 Tax=Ananas comosus var. bracteatus TaxID=296719 RepID=A0A6V7PNT1_ANACO|nr:unnamed protein product [Ananas comosus var. bracteatus]
MLRPPVHLPFPSLKYAHFIGTTSSAYRPSSAAAAAAATARTVEPPRRESLQRPCRLPRDPQPRRSDLHSHHLLLPPPRPKKLIGPRLYTDRGDLEQPCDFWQNPASFHEVFIVIVVIIFIIIPVFVHCFGGFSFGTFCNDLITIEFKSASEEMYPTTSLVGYVVLISNSVHQVFFTWRDLKLKGKFIKYQIC